MIRNTASVLINDVCKVLEDSSLWLLEAVLME